MASLLESFRIPFPHQLPDILTLGSGTRPYIQNDRRQHYSTVVSTKQCHSLSSQTTVIRGQLSVKPKKRKDAFPIPPEKCYLELKSWVSAQEPMKEEKQA